jgi:hypothetical protein
MIKLAKKIIGSYLTARQFRIDTTYAQDGLKTIHNSDFMNEEKFKAAYQRGLQACRGDDYNFHWRVHVGLWASTLCSRLKGDFIEFGVNKGFMSSAIMQSLDWNSQNKKFYLLDTFHGLDERSVLDIEKKEGILENNRQAISNGFYTTSIESVRANFSEWERVIIIEGAVPETLSLIDSNTFSFVHIDMNCAPPEVAALEFIWPKLEEGGVVLLDDYAFRGYHNQKLAIDRLGKKIGFETLSLPTGQGVIIKSS